MRKRYLIAAVCFALFSGAALVCTSALGAGASASYGIAAKRPVFGAACPVCIWGPIGEVVKRAMQPYGYDVQICYNCNLAESPLYVAKALIPHNLTPEEKAIGDPSPPKAPVDFGVTNAYLLWFAYDGLYDYKADGPQHQLRLIAFLGDPQYFLAAVKSTSGITDLRQIKEKHLPVRVVANQDVMGKAVLAYYGLTKEALESWGGKLMTPDAKTLENFDVIISDHASLSNNLEDRLFYNVSQKFNLRYLGLAPQLRNELVQQFKLVEVDVPRGLLRGVERPIPTVVRNGQAIYTRADVPDDFTYAVAKAIDEHQRLFEYLIRPYFYNVHHVWRTVGNVPLAPGAMRYYKEVGYLK
jgi:uncharacterized protein